MHYYKYDWQIKKGCNHLVFPNRLLQGLHLLIKWCLFHSSTLVSVCEGGACVSVRVLVCAHAVRACVGVELQPVQAI